MFYFISASILLGDAHAMELDDQTAEQLWDKVAYGHRNKPSNAAQQDENWHQPSVTEQLAALKRLGQLHLRLLHAQ